jgi:RNA polymerase sigma factor (TIGR02999 family)
MSLTLQAVNEPASTAPITRLLHEWQGGSQDALERLVPLVYDELHILASRQLAREWRHNRLQTTVVLNEAYLKLCSQREVDWQNRGHFFALAAKLIRRILVDDVRRRVRQKRGGGEMPVELDEVLAAPGGAVDIVDLIDLDRALQNLEQRDPDLAQIVELRFFAGLTLEETAAALGVSTATVKRDWAVGRAFLHLELTGGQLSSTNLPTS